MCRWPSYTTPNGTSMTLPPSGLGRPVAVGALGDEGGERAERGQRIEVEVLAGDVHAEPPVHLAQQQRAGQRVESHARAEQGRLGGQAEQFLAPGRPRQDLPQLADDLRRLAAGHGPVTPLRTSPIT